MTPWVAGLLAAGLLAWPAAAQEKGQGKLKERPKAEQQQPSQEEQVPPEEDEGAKVKEYAFNPLQSQKEVQIGNFYWKKGSYKAATLRFREATKWNPGNAEAWLRLAEAEEKQKDEKGAREAYGKYLELEPDAKNAAAIKKKLARR